MKDNSADKEAADISTERRNFVTTAMAAGVLGSTGIAMANGAVRFAAAEPQDQNPQAPAGLRRMGQPDNRFPTTFQECIPEGTRVVMRFFTAMCRRDLEAVAQTLHYPFVTYEETEPVIVESQEELLESPPPSMNFRAPDGGYFREKSYDVMETLGCVLFNPVGSGFSLSWNRYRASGERLLCCHGIYGVTNNDGRWAIEYMSTIFKPADQYYETYNADAIYAQQHDVWRDHDLARKTGNTRLLLKNSMTPGKFASVSLGAPDREGWREGKPMDVYRIKGVKSRLHTGFITQESIDHPSADMLAKWEAENRRFKTISSSPVGAYFCSLESAGPNGRGCQVLAANTEKGHLLEGYSRYTQDGSLIYESRSLNVVRRVNGQWLVYEAFHAFGGVIHRDHANDTGLTTP